MRLILIPLFSLAMIASAIVACAGNKEVASTPSKTAIAVNESASSGVSVASVSSNSSESGETENGEDEEAEIEDNEKYGTFRSFGRHRSLDSMTFVGVEKVVLANDTIEVNVYTYLTEPHFLRDEIDTVFHKEDSAETIMIDSVVSKNDKYSLTVVKEVSRNRLLMMEQRSPRGEKKFTYMTEKGRVLDEYVVGLPKSRYSYTNGTLKPGYVKVLGDTVFMDMDCVNAYYGCPKKEDKDQDSLSTKDFWHIGSEFVVVNGDSVELQVFQGKEYYGKDEIEFKKKNKEETVVIDSVVNSQNESSVEETNLIGKYLRNRTKDGVTKFHIFNDEGVLIKMFSVTGKDTLWDKHEPGKFGPILIDKRMSSKKIVFDKNDTLSSYRWRFKGAEKQRVRGKMTRLNVFENSHLSEGMVYGTVLKEAEDGSYRIEELYRPDGLVHITKTDYVTRKEFAQIKGNVEIVSEYGESGDLIRKFALNYKPDEEKCQVECACSAGKVKEVKGDTTFFDISGSVGKMDYLRYRKVYRSEKISNGEDTLLLNVEWEKRADWDVFRKIHWRPFVGIDSIVYPDGTYEVSEFGNEFTGETRTRDRDGRVTFRQEDKDGKIIESYVIGFEKDRVYREDGTLDPFYREVRGDTAFHNVEWLNKMMEDGRDGILHFN